MNQFHPEHPHYAINKEWIEKCFANPADLPVVEFHDTGKWRKVIGVPAWFAKTGYRLKPRMLTRTVSYLEPLRVAPLPLTVFWMALPNCKRAVTCVWAGSNSDFAALKNGMVFATEADAQSCHDALFVQCDSSL